MPNADETLKKHKTYFTNVSRITILLYIHFRSGRRHFIKKGQSCCTLINRYLHAHCAPYDSTYKKRCLCGHAKKDLSLHMGSGRFLNFPVDLCIKIFLVFSAKSMYANSICLFASIINLNQLCLSAVNCRCRWE